VGIDPDIERAVTEQIGYYGERAPEYDDWFFRRGRYDRGDAFNRTWSEAVGEFHRALQTIEGRSVLEIGCGTGLTTQVLAGGGREVVAIDSSPQMLKACARRVGDGVTLHEADLYEFEPGRVFDAVVFTFVLSHVPLDRFERFWSKIGDWLAPGGTAFLADSLDTSSSTAVDHELTGPDSQTVLRRLNDGREFTIVKVFHEPSALTERLAQIGWTTDIRQASDLLYHGTARRAIP
jgi:2-polyprenyl-3-methyl-5-hydroxy-6-metoxy-1,4-benzoquinol methylase